MDLGKIKNLVKQNGDKFIFVENGEPEMVVMSFQEYQRLAAYNANDANRHANTANKIDNRYADHLGEELESLGSPPGLEETEFMAPVLAESAGLPVRLEDIRLEDLPI